MIRHILHINIVNFYIAVEQVLNPKLGSYPVAVATSGSTRRILLDVSLCAREAGLFKGMLVDAARRKCPDLIVLNPSPNAYSRAGNALMGEASRLSPFVESAGPGHVFIDLSGTHRLFGRSIDIADRFRKEVKNKFNLENAVGLGTSKLVSKVATRVIKPAGLCTVLAGCEETFMAPLPIRFLPGIDYKVIRQLYQFNLRYINDIREIKQELLFRAVGTVAIDICRFSRGIDTVPVREQQTPAPSIEKSAVFKEQTNDDTVILKELFKLVVRCGMKLRKMGLAAGKLHLTVTYYDGSQSSRSDSLPVPLNGDLSLFERFHMLFTAVYTRRIRLTSLCIRLTELSYPYGQLDLFDDSEKEDRLMGALDGIRNRFGSNAVKFWGLPGYERGAA